MRSTVIGDAPVIDHRPADDIAPELKENREAIKDYILKDEDVLTYAMFPQVALKFFQDRKAAMSGEKQEAAEPKKSESVQTAKVEPSAQAPQISVDQKIRKLYVEDLTI